jgi:hypothetical protein
MVSMSYDDDSTKSYGDDGDDYLFGEDLIVLINLMIENMMTMMKMKMMKMILDKMI